MSAVVSIGGERKVLSCWVMLQSSVVNIRPPAGPQPGNLVQANPQGISSPFCSVLPITLPRSTLTLLLWM